MNILIVEDDKEIRKILNDCLILAGYNVSEEGDGNRAEIAMRNDNYDLILLDLMLPGLSGEYLIKELRKYSDTPVIIISAKSAMETRLEMLRVGADDYITKPFDIDEVLVRIQVVLRRAGLFEAKNKLETGGLTLYTEECRAEYAGTSLNLTLKEAKLLEMFMANPAKTFTKANLYEHVWGDVYYYEDNTINVHMSNLRNKLKKATGKDLIETVWGIGYRFKA